MFRFIFHAAAAVSALLLLALLALMMTAKPPAPMNPPLHPVQKQFALTAHPDGLHLTTSRPQEPSLYTMYIGGNMASGNASYYYKTTPQGTLILHSDGRAQTKDIKSGTYYGMKWQSGAATPTPRWEPPAPINEKIKNRRDEFWPALALVPWHSLTIPYRYPLIVAAICPLFWILGNLKRLCRHAHGCCKQCGYDLRATPSRCPECGAVPQSAGFAPTITSSAATAP